MIFKKKLFILVFIFFFNLNNLYSLDNKILVKIDNEILTSIDILKEANYLIAFNKQLRNLEETKIFEIAKKSLITETIKKKEILRYTDNIEINESLLNDAINSLYKNQNYNSYESFIESLNQQEVSIEYIKNKILIDIFWKDLIVSKFSNKIKIDILAIKNDLKKNSLKKSKEYLLSELIFNIPPNTSLEQKINLIYGDIEKKGFENAVLIHSISNNTSNNGGKIGWIGENSLNKNIKKNLDSLKSNQVTKPITIPGGFLILRINDIRYVNNKDFNIDKKINEMVKIKQNEQFNNYSNIYFNKLQKESIINEL